MHKSVVWQGTLIYLFHIFVWHRKASNYHLRGRFGRNQFWAYWCWWTYCSPVHIISHLISFLTIFSSLIWIIFRFAADIFTEGLMLLARSINPVAPTLFHAKLSPHAKSYKPPRGTKISPNDVLHQIDTSPKKLEWLLSGELRAGIRFAETRLSDLICQNDCQALEFKGYGKNFITSHGFSPDAFVQMAFQAGFYGLYGRTECTYEPAMTKSYLHGRTEAIRTVQPESVAFTKVCNTEATVRFDTDARPIRHSFPRLPLKTKWTLFGKPVHDTLNSRRSAVKVKVRIGRIASSFIWAQSSTEFRSAIYMHCIASFKEIWPSRRPFQHYSKTQGGHYSVHRSYLRPIAAIQPWDYSDLVLSQLMASALAISLKKTEFLCEPRLKRQNWCS